MCRESIVIHAWDTHKWLPCASASCHHLHAMTGGGSMEKWPEAASPEPLRCRPSSRPKTHLPLVVAEAGQVLRTAVAWCLSDGLWSADVVAGAQTGCSLSYRKILWCAQRLSRFAGKPGTCTRNARLEAAYPLGQASELSHVPRLFLSTLRWAAETTALSSSVFSSRTCNRPS